MDHLSSTKFCEETKENLQNQEKNELNKKKGIRGEGGNLNET